MELHPFSAAIGVSLPSAKQCTPARLGSGRTMGHRSDLAAFRFTNVYRASDRVSQYLIQHVQYIPIARPRRPNFSFAPFCSSYSIE